MSVGQHIKTETFKHQADLFSRQRELMKQGVKQFSISFDLIVENEDDVFQSVWEMSYPFRDEELGPEGPDGGNSPHLYADEERRAA